MQGINCIKGEIHNVLTVLRLNSASSGGLYSGSEMQEMEAEEQQLIRGLKELYELICMHQDLAHVDTLAYLDPFLFVITSKHTDIFTTAIALHSIHKFLVYGLIHAESPNVAAALTKLADSVTHCTFDVTDGEDAEVVSMKILEILLETLRCSAGEFLTDQAVVDMITECFHVRSQQHSSKLLRRYAENVLMQMVLVLFARISPESSNASDLNQSRASSPSPTPLPIPGHARDSSGTTPSLTSSSQSGGPRHRSLSVHSTIKDWSATTEISVHKFNTSTRAAAASSLSNTAAFSTTAAAASSAASAAPAPYGIPALHRVFRFLTNLINPGDGRNTEQDRILGLRLIRTVLETSSARIGTFPPLIQVIQDECCKYLLQNSQSKNLFVLSLTLRIVFDLFITVKAHLKVQLEVFFTSIHLRIGESPSSTFQQKELVLESLVEFCKEVSLIVGLYRNYDSELGCTDLFQDLCKFLANTAMQPWSPTLHAHVHTGGGGGGGGKANALSAGGHANQLNVLSLEGMVGVLNAITKRFCSQYHSQAHAQSHHLHATAQQQDHAQRMAMRTAPALTPSNALSFGAGRPSHAHPQHFTSGGAAGEESDDESTLLILSPDEEAHLLNKRANKQKLALAANYFNQEGLTPKCIKYLQSLKILPPSSTPAPEADEATNVMTTSADSLTAPQSTDATVASPPADGNGPRVKVPRPPPKSKHDPFIPPLSIVHFFRSTPGLDKVKIGEYLGDADPYNIRVLDAFVETFDFARVPKTLPPVEEAESEGPTDGPIDTAAVAARDETSLDDALRSFLDGFKLPGESQQIARIIERFSTAFFGHCAGPLKSADAAYVLCYSVIMLNTDAHNPQVTRKMTKDMYCRNLRGINDREDLPRAYLENLFDSIVNNEIKIQSDSLKDIAASGGATDAAGWDRMLSNRARGTKPGSVESSFQTSAPRIHGREMFLLIWQQCISIFIHYLESTGTGAGSTREGWMLPMHAPETTTTDMPATARSTAHSHPSGAATTSASSSAASLQHLEHLKILPKIVQGFSLFCRICAVYDLNDILNHLLIALCKCLVGFFEELCTEANWETKEIQIAFARDFRIGHLLQLLFTILAEYGEGHVLEGWSNAVHVMLWLRQMELLPATWLEMEDFRDTSGKPLESVRATSQNTHAPNPHRLEKAQHAKTEGKGFWGFWRGTPNDAHASHAADGSPTLTTTEQHWIGRAKEIVALCHIPELFESSRYFRPSPLSHLVRSLILISSSGTKSLTSIAASSFSPHILHEESAVFCLERLADVTEKNQARLDQKHSTQEHHTSHANGHTPSSTALVSTPGGSSSGHNGSSSAAASLHLWSTISAHLELSITHARSDATCTFYIERLVVNLLRFSVRLVYSRETTTQLVRLLALLLQLPRATFAKLAQRIIAGTSLFLQTHGESISRVGEWEIVFSLLLQFKHHPFSAHSAFQTFTYVIENHCTLATFVPLMHALTAYAQTSDEKDAWLPVAPEAVLALLLRLHSKLATIAMPEVPLQASPHGALTAAQAQHLSAGTSARRQLDFDRARTDLWLASLQNFCAIVRGDERSSVRKAALEALNNSLLAVGVSPPISPLGWKICFEKLLVPLLEGVQRFPPEAASPRNNDANNKVGSSRSSNETSSSIPPFDLRLKAATLVFQAFLHHLDVLCEMTDFHIFFLAWVGSMERYMQQGTVDSGRGALSLHLSESLKNLLLVMHSSGVFAAITAKTGQNLLALTWAVIDSFRPELRQQLQEHMGPLTAQQQQHQQARAKPVEAAAGGGGSGYPPMHSPSATTTAAAASPNAYKPAQLLAPSPKPAQLSASKPSTPVPSKPPTPVLQYQPNPALAQATPASAASVAPSPAGIQSYPALAAGAIDFSRLAPLSSGPHDSSAPTPPRPTVQALNGSAYSSPSTQFQPISPATQQQQLYQPAQHPLQQYPPSMQHPQLQQQSYAPAAPWQSSALPVAPWAVQSPQQSRPPLPAASHHPLAPPPMHHAPPFPAPLPQAMSSSPALGSAPPTAGARNGLPWMAPPPFPNGLVMMPPPTTRGTSAGATPLPALPPPAFLPLNGQQHKLAAAAAAPPTANGHHA